MTVWRLARRAFAKNGRQAYSGFGAAQRGARWNSRGFAVAYASDSPALALLEYLSHIDRTLLPTDLCYYAAEIPDGEVRTLVTLPAGWDAVPSTGASVRAGDAWLEARSSLALKVPSAIVPRQYNVLINPLHDAFARIAYERAIPHVVDARLVEGFS